MKRMPTEYTRIRYAWEGRISGCILGKPIEVLSILQGRDDLLEYLKQADALPLRDYIPLLDNPLVEMSGGRNCCKEFISRAEPDDDIMYTVLALVMLEKYGLSLSTEGVARTWLQLLPGGQTFTAERAAYKILLEKASIGFTHGMDPGFDVSECAANEWSEWIGAQIRADLYGWVCPGQPTLAAELARRDTALSHTSNGIHGAEFIAAFGAAIPASPSLQDALDHALKEIPAESDAARAVAFGRSLVGVRNAVDQLHDRYRDINPVHTLNNLALVIWGLLSSPDDYSKAIGETVAAGLDTDCNGATVGGLWGLQGKPIPEHWTNPWQGRIAVPIAGVGELSLENLVKRTVAVAEKLYHDKPL